MAATKKTSKVRSKVASLTRPETGIGISQGLITFIVLSIVTAGLYAFVSSRGQVYPLVEQVPWAILCSTCGLFAAACTGLFFIAITACAFGGRSLASFVNRTLFLAIASACATVAIVFIHFIVIGGATQSPWNSLVRQVFALDLVDHVLSPDSTSNIWWIRTLMGGAFSSMLLMFWANSTGRTTLAFLIGAFGGLFALGATMSVGAAVVTSGLVVQPVWYGGGQMGLYLVFSSLMVGAATLILLTHLSHAIHGTTAAIPQDTKRSLEVVGQVLMYSTYAVLVATAWRYYSIFAGSFEGTDIARPTADVLVHGLLSANFWGIEIAVGLILPVLLLTRTRGKNLSVLSICSIMVLVGAVFERYDMLLAGRMIPVEVQWQNIAMTFSYLPSLSELLLVISGIGLVGAILLIGEWFFGTDFRYSVS